MRPDGTRVKDLPPLVAAIPYIMPKRYDVVGDGRGTIEPSDRISTPPKG